MDFFKMIYFIDNVFFVIIVILSRYALLTSQYSRYWSIKVLSFDDVLESCLVQRIKYPVSFMVWSVISAKGMMRLYIVEEIMRQDQYKSKLEARLPSLLEKWIAGDGKYIFMFDFALRIKARSVTAFQAAKNDTVLLLPKIQSILTPQRTNQKGNR